MLLTVAKAMQNTETTLKFRLWTVEEYYWMAEAGIFGADERLELLEGKIIWMSAKGTAHRSAVGRTDRLLQNSLRNRALICVQDPVKLNERSEPEPYQERCLIATGLRTFLQEFVKIYKISVFG